jgi:hypothetical protein
LQLVRRLRIPAFLCALAVLLCELIARPYANMGVCDDWPYILMARTLAATGHIAYNGWGAPMLTWQLYLADAIIKLFGFSFTAVRSSTVLVAMALAFVLQRTFFRCGLSEANATLGTLALVLSPLYLMLSVTFMTDIFGLFAVLICLYGCIRSLEASTSRAAILWLIFAALTNALCGTSRQIAWLGLLVMVPSTLWLLRTRRPVFLAGMAVNLAGIVFIFACMHWLKRQPYSIPEHLLPNTFSLVKTLREFFFTFIDLPFLLLPLTVVFLPGLRKASRPVLASLSVVALLYAALAFHYRVFESNLMLIAHGNWVGIHGIYEGVLMQGKPPRFLSTPVQILLTIFTLGGLFGFIATVFRRPPPIASDAPSPSLSLSWKELGIVLAPFTLAYILLLIPRAAKAEIFDRYLLAFLVVALLCLVRYYQEHLQPRLPLAAPLVIAALAAYGTACTHNLFSLYRARVALGDELRAYNIPPTSVDNGWEYNLGTELQYAPSINFPAIVVPAHFYTPAPPLPAGTCSMLWSDYTPHVRPLYTVSFDPNACSGPAPFVPVHYDRWFARTPGTLYVVRTTPANTH